MAVSNTPSYDFMKGWDMIAGTKQKTVNALLQKLPDILVDYSTKVNVFGKETNARVEILVRPPSINVKAISGRQVDVIFPISGTVALGNCEIELPDKPKPKPLIATLQLTQIEAELQDRKGEKKTRFDLIFDLKSKDLIVNLEYKGIHALTLAIMQDALKKTLQDYIAENHQYKVVSFYLNNDVVDKYKAFIPHLADFSFVRDDADPDESNLLVLMLTVNQKRGNIFFNGPILPKGVEYIVMINNHLFLQQMILPGIEDNIKKEAKDPNSVENKITITPIDKTHELWEISNSKHIDLNKDHDSWIEKIECKVDQKVNQLMVYLDVKADATFLQVHVDTWDRTWIKMEFEGDELKTTKAKEESGHSAKMEWWKWLIAAVNLYFSGVIAGIIYAIVSAKVPSLHGKFDKAATNTVVWPYQKTVAIQQVKMPGHIVFEVDIKID